MINSFTWFYHLKVFLKTCSKRTELCNRHAMVRDWEKWKKAMLKGLLYFKNHIALNRIPYIANLPQGSEVQGFPKSCFIPTDPSLGGNIQFTTHARKYCHMLLLSMLLLVSLLPELEHLYCSHQSTSNQLPASQILVCSTADINSIPRGQGHELHFALCRLSLVTVEYISSKKWFIKGTRTKEMQVHIHTHTRTCL